MASHFFALFSRMKHIDRWALMRNTERDALSSHCLEVSAIAHCLALIGNRRLHKSYNADRAALLGIYHDMPEIITGDMPTPVKYYNTAIRTAYAQIETAAQGALLRTLPPDLREDYAPLLQPDETDDLHRLVKAADKISALIKCVEERESGNPEFSAAETATREAIRNINCPEAEIFIEEFLPSFSLVLDSVLQNEDP